MPILPKVRRRRWGLSLGLWLSTLYALLMMGVLWSLTLGNPWFSVAVLVLLLPASIPVDYWVQQMPWPDPHMISGGLFVAIAMNMLLWYAVGQALATVGRSLRRSR